MRWRAYGLLAVVVALGAGGCSGQSEADRQQLAYAKCGLPLEQELALPDGQTWDRSEAGIEDLGDGGYRVTGVITIYTDGSADVTDRLFTCEVAPDSSDERGFRVVALDIGPALR